MQNPDDLINFIARLMIDEDCTVIRPHKDQFRRFERDFLEGIRRIPARIDSPAGTNPYSRLAREPGRWVFVWVPERD